MRTIDPILSAAAQNGTGVPFARIKQLNPVTLEVLQTANIHKFKMDRFTCDVWCDFLSHSFSICLIERGLIIQGVEYPISSPYFFPQSIDAISDPENNTNHISLIAWNNNQTYYRAVPADNYVQNVMDGAMPTHFTARFLNAEPWQYWEYEAPGTNLYLNSLADVFPQIWNKYAVKCFPRDEGQIWFKSKLSTSYETATAYSWTKSQLTEIYPFSFNYKPRWNAFWTDETGATSRLSAHFSGPENYGLRNVGFIPSTADIDDIANLHYYNAAQNLYHWKYTLSWTPEVEQGDLVKAVENRVLIADIVESFNMNGTKYPWQTEIKGESMYFEY